MIQQQKILRVFKLIRYLMQKPYKTLEQLSNNLGVDSRTTRRYFKLLEEIGYIIDQDFANNYFIHIDTHPAEEGVRFTLEESQLLRDLLHGNAERHPLRDTLWKKLFVQSELQPLAENILKNYNTKILQTLVKAIENRRQVVLHNYHSANTNSVKDRLVEPLEFSDNYTAIQAFESSSQLMKSYKIDRIEEVTLLDTPQNYPRSSSPTDLFGFIGEHSWTVKLRLSELAYRLLIEEFPITKPDIKKMHSGSSHPYIFESKIRDERGIGRFILGIPGEIVVESPTKLKDYLNGRIQGVRF